MIPFIYHVAKDGCDSSLGTREQPLATISRAAAIAQAGDTVIVHEGVYREWVKPAQGGTSDISRITYQTAEGEKVVIKGSERIRSWEKYEGTIWKATIPNIIFGDYNPYSQRLFGDWFLYPEEYQVHAGEVYLNGKSFFEAASLDEVLNPLPRTTGFNPPWTRRPELIPHPEDTIYRWFAQVDEQNTTLYANFHEHLPNDELTEINVRKCCFYPQRSGLDYITVRGFEMAQAACPWTPPTADQPGLLGPHWSRGWTIENNVIHDAKCSGISIGKDAATGDGLSARLHRKSGYQHHPNVKPKTKINLSWA